MSEKEKKQPEQPQQADFANMPEVPEKERLNWVYENTKRIIYYINTMEHWRHAKFKSLDELKNEQKEAANGKEQNDKQGADGESKPTDTDSNNPA